MDIQDAVRIVLEFLRENNRPPRREEFRALAGISHRSLENIGFNNIIRAAGLETYHKTAPTNYAKPPKILLIDIETAPVTARVWGLFDQNVGLNQITEDWFIMSFAAEVDGIKHYLDQRYSKPVSDDSMLLMAIHHLFSQADIVVGHNVKRFDIKKINARFLKHGMSPPSSYRVIDTLTVAKKNFALTSNKLEYLAKFLGVGEKLTRRQFSGMDLWNECLAGNMEAWNEMQAYNEMDTEILRKVYEKLIRWDKSISFSMFHQEHVCTCGDKRLRQDGFITTNSGKFERFMCDTCGKEYRGKENLVHPDTRKELLR